MGYLSGFPFPYTFAPASVPGSALDTATQGKINNALQNSNNLNDVSNKPTACANLGAVQKAGDTMSGSLTLNAVPLYWRSNAANGGIGGVFTTSTGAVLGVFQFDINYGIGFVNAAQTAWNFSVSDAGNMIVKGGATLGGSVGINNSSNLSMNGGRVYMQTAAGALNGIIAGDASYGIGTINIAQNQWNWYVTDAGNMNVRGTIASSAGISGTTGTFSGLITCPQIKLLGGSYGPYISINASASPHYMGFINSAGTAWTFTVDDSGNAGIGASLNVPGNTTVGGVLNTTGGSTIGGTLTVNGNAIAGHYRITMYSQSSSSGEIALQAGDNTAVGYMRGRGGSQGGFEFINNAYTAAVMNSDDSGQFTCRVLVQTSDYRLKKNIQTINPNDGLNAILAMRPVAFDWIESETASKGFLAHELQAIESAAVDGEKDAMKPALKEGEPDIIAPQGVNMNPVIADLVAAVQALQAQVSELKAKLAGV